MAKRICDITKKDLKDWLSDSDHSATADEIDQTEEALIRFADDHAIQSPSHLKNAVLEKLKKLKKQKINKQVFDLNDLPRLTENSNLYAWQELAEGIQPPEDYTVYLHPIEQSNKRELFVAWAKEPIPEEVHHDLLESFLILQGTCECHITAEDGSFRKVRLGPGEMISLKKGETHDIIITSEQPVVAILEWWYEAA